MKNDLNVYGLKETKFYEFTQNNSGGSFVVDEKLCHRVIVEAKDEDEACDIAERMGVYFNGCEDGHDCECCGDRWYRPDELKIPYSYGAFEKAGAEKIAKKYGAETAKREKGLRERDTDVVFLNVESYAQYLADDYAWTSPDVRIFYKDGTVKEIEGEKFVKRKRK